MINQLTKYEAACRALAECKSVDEAKNWADKAAAMQAYGRMAKDRTMEVDAAEIRIRAERRLGEMLAMQKADGGLNTGVKVSGAKAGANDGSSAVVATDRRPKLSDAGISKDLSSRAQKLAAVPEAEFEAELAAKRERDREDGARVSARLQAAGEREQKKAKVKQAKPATTPDPDADADADADAPEDYTELDAAHDLISELQSELVVARMGDIPEDQKTQAAERIADLQAEVNTLTATLAAVTLSRDSLMAERNQMLRQMKAQRAEIARLKAGK